MSIGLASDSRGKVIISVAFASCVIGGIGYLKYIQNQQNTAPYVVNKIIEHANRTSVVEEIVGTPVALEAATSTEGEIISFYVKGPGGSAGQLAKLHACGTLVGDKWQQDSAHLELSNGECAAIPAQPDLAPVEVEQQAPDRPNYLFMVAVALGLGASIAVVLNRILHRRAGATGTVPDAVFALARQHVAEAR